ncbi:MAG: InlB B-repeat-containing protein, partial [Fibrobacter sp.]|nr:InlB B-repeat-containing protein [Fibrobacter sp.]
MKHCTFSFRKIILAFACVFAVGQAFGLTTTKIDGKTYYKIQSCTDLKDFSGLVNGGSLSANAILTQNIDCNGITTTSAPLIPIGQDASKIYQGTFDGAGYTINKVIVQMGEGSDQYAGLIGYLGADGLVQNVVLYNLSVKASTKSGADDYVGGIAGKTAGTIKTCTVTGDATIEGRRMVGGITGYATKTALIENSLCTAKINAMGSADYDQSSKSATYVGGIVGRGEHGTRVFSCVYSGNTITRIETDESGQPENASNVFPIAGGPVTLDECYFDGVNISGEARSCGNNNNEAGSCSLGYDENSCQGTWTASSKNTIAPKCTIGGVDVFGNKTNCESKGGDWLISACGKGTENLRDPELICKLNKGNFIGGECYNGTEIWSDEEQLTNQSGVNSSGEGTSYAILFDPNGGTFDGGRTTPDTVRVNADEPISAPEAVPSRVGDEFLGWAKEYNATTPTAFGNAVGAMTFYAVWKNSVVITFDANGGEFPNNPVTNKRVAKNHAIDTVGISVPSTRGATFLGWSRNKNATVADETLGSSSDPVTFYAVYSGSYKVSFNSNGGSFPNGATREKTVSVGADFTAEGITQPNPPSSVYTFAGWSLDQNADASEAISSSSAVIGTMNVSEITVYAVWSVKKWTITFDPNGGYFDNQNNSTGKTPKTKTFIDGEKINSNGISTTNPPVMKASTTNKGKTTNYYFLGWAETSSSSTVLKDLGTASENKTFYAVWATEKVYDVTFDANGYGSVPEGQHVVQTSHGKVSQPADLTATGAIFEGWCKDARSCMNTFDFDTEVTANMTLYAKWTVNSHTINYRIYDKASGEELEDKPDSETVPYGTKVSVTTKIVPGFNYTAWQSESDNVIFADDGSFVMPDNDVELYCFRSTGVYTLTWDLKGGEYASYDGEYSPAGQYNFGETIYAPILRRDGYTFEGWTLDGEHLVDFPREMPSTNTKFYAKWMANGPYKLTIQVVGAPANVPSYPDGVQGGTSVTLTVPDFTPRAMGALYHFLGWEENYSDIEISSSNTFTMPNYDVRIIAKFVQKPVILYTKGECSTCTGDDIQIIKEYGASYTIKGSSDKVFSRTGYEHKGWTTVEGGSAVEYAFGATYTGNDNLTLYPVWEAVTLNLAWNFTLPEGWSADDISYGEFPVGSYSYDTQLDKPTVSKFGYDVDWYTTSACAANPAGTGCTAWNFDEDKLVGSQDEMITLYGHVVKRTLTVTYHLLNEAGGSDAVPSFKKEYTIDDLYDGKFLYYNINENTVIPEDRIYVDGYGYVVWYRTRNCENMALYEKISNNSGFSAAVELYGLVDGYKITYHAGTGATGDDVVRKKTYGEDYTLEGAGLFTRDNYTQVGWARTDGGAKALDLGATYNVDVGMGSGLDLYPVWELTSYTITYMDENDVISADLLNENTPATFTVESSDIALVDAKTKIEDGAEESGYIFEGWYSEPEFETKVEMIPAGSHENVVLYAKYTRAYKITYFLDGAPSDVWLLPGAAVEPSMPTEAGFTFSGWNVWYRYVDNTIDSIPQPTEMPEYNVVAEGFLKSRVTVTFDANGGVFGDDQTTPYSKYVTKSVVITDEGVPMISKAGSQFMGWASSAESMEPVTSFGVANVEDVTFYAIWKPIVTITVAANESKPYNGEAQTITVTWTGLPDGYSVVCDASLTNVSEGLKTITCDKIVDGNGTDVTDNYYSVFTDGRTTGSFSIEKASPTVVVSLDDWTCAGEPSTPSVTPEYISAESVTYVYAKTDADTMVVANWSSDVPSNAGDYYVKAIVAETDNYDGGSATAEFKIDTKSSAGLVVTFSPESATYTGNDQTPTVVVKDGDNTLTLDKDYMVAWNATPNAAGTYTATVTYIGDYSGTKTAEFTVAAKSVSDIVVTVTPPNFVYTGSALTPVVTVKDGDNALTFGTDYTVSGLDNVIGVGSYEVTISGTGNYNGTATATFTVSPVITMNLGDGETLECSAGAKGAAACNETQDNIVHVYGSATAELPDAVKSGWTFVGWYDNAKFENAAVESIAADRDDALSLYPKFEKAITVVYGTSAEDVLDVTIDSDDSADDIETKIETAVKEALDGKLPEKGTTDSDPYRYEFDKFVKNPETGNYEPSFKSIPKEYTITYNMNGGTAPAESFQKYTYSKTDAFPLPIATDVPYTNWTFGGWFAAADFSGTAVTEIAAESIGDKAFYALYTQKVTVKYGDAAEDVLDVTIDSDDSADDI